MLNVSALNLEQLGMVYLVANTPSYLYRHFRLDSSIQEVARGSSVEELNAAIKEKLSIPTERRTIEDIVLIYALLVALTFKDQVEVERSITSIELTTVDWGKKILDIWKNSSGPTTKVMNFRINPKVQIPNNNVEVNSNNIVLNFEV